VDGWQIERLAAPPVPTNIDATQGAGRIEAMHGRTRRSAGWGSPHGTESANQFLNPLLGTLQERPVFCMMAKRGEDSLTKDLQELIERARKIEMTPDQLGEQRRSFAYGNTHIENERITREMVAIIDSQLHVKKG
jgi:hypothetical protein